jgi:hypothetical protein
LLELRPTAERVGELRFGFPVGHGQELLERDSKGLFRLPALKTLLAALDGARESFVERVVRSCWGRFRSVEWGRERQALPVRACPFESFHGLLPLEGVDLLAELETAREEALELRGTPRFFQLAILEASRFHSSSIFMNCSVASGSDGSAAVLSRSSSAAADNSF